jgi:hypothetical protein
MEDERYENPEDVYVPDSDIEVCECGNMIESCPDAYEHMTQGY